MKLKHKLISFILCVAVTVGMMLFPVGAAIRNEETVQPLWENTYTVQVNMAYIEGKGYAESLVQARFDTTSIATDVYIYMLYNGTWIYFTELHETIYDFVAAASCEFTAIHGATYRADFTFTVTRNGLAEVIHRTEYAVCPNPY